jgi:hypothetical protein
VPRRADVRLLHRLFDDVGFILELTTNVNVSEKQIRQKRNPLVARSARSQGKACSARQALVLAVRNVPFGTPHRTAVQCEILLRPRQKRMGESAYAARARMAMPAI